MIRWWHISTRDDVKRKEPQGGSGVTTSADDEETFVLCDEIIDRIYGFFPPPDDHHDRIYQACRALQALGGLPCPTSNRLPSPLTNSQRTPNPAMGGAPIRELNEGLKAFRQELSQDSLAMKRVEDANCVVGDVNHGSILVAQDATVALI